jgi:DHA1 family bicyclomycin/chloramphenicol resistance-like MFS transporter
VLMSRLMLVMGAAPILAPSIGGAVLAFGSWRWIFWILAAYGATAFLLVVATLPDTLPAPARMRLTAAEQARRYAHILRERSFLSHAALGGFATFAFFAYLGGSSPVFIDGFGFSPSVYAVLFGGCAVGLIACSQLNALLVPRFGQFLVLRAATLIDLAATATLLAVALLRIHRLEAVFPPLFVFVSCQGFINPNATVGALSRHAGHAGSASALMGMGQFLLGAISGLAVGALTDGTPRGMAGLMLAGAVGMIVADRCRPRQVQRG